MDHIRQDLNELMGKDRNHPLHIRLKKRDHFDDEDVCFSSLLLLHSLKILKPGLKSNNKTLLLTILGMQV